MVKVVFFICNAKEKQTGSLIVSSPNRSVVSGVKHCRANSKENVYYEIFKNKLHLMSKEILKKDQTK